MKVLVMALWAAIITLTTSISAAAHPVFDAFKSLCADNRADQGAAIRRADANRWNRLTPEQLARLAANVGLQQADGRWVATFGRRMLLMTGIRVYPEGGRAVADKFCSVSGRPGGSSDLPQVAARWAAVAPIRHPVGAPANSTIYEFVDHLGLHRPIEGSAQEQDRLIKSGGAFRLIVLSGADAETLILEALPRVGQISAVPPPPPAGDQIASAQRDATPQRQEMERLGDLRHSPTHQQFRRTYPHESSYAPRVIESGPPAEPIGRDRFAGAAENAFRIVREAPVSTFSIDVDTASYSFVRASLNRNVLPQPASVRTEELINYFPYAYETPSSAAEPFRTAVTVFPNPWAEGRKIVRIGIKGYAVEAATRPRANLVFLIDTSGSMEAPNRLPLVKQSLAMLVGQLEASDRVAIVTYAGRAGTALEPTAASDKGRILGVIERLEASGSTAGGEGVRQAYALAEQNFDADGVNRVILATDGDFNVGITNREELKGFVERQRAKGIFLSVLGFGMGNYNDALMQALAQNGNGVAAYIDTINEARKVLVEEATSTLIPIAKDVKIQVEFNPATVAEYRLIGYETRLLNRDDFANDKVDAGDVGSGQTVTALYDIVPVGGPRISDELRYGPSAAAQADRPAAHAGEYAFVKIRYKLPKSDASTLITTPVDRSVEHARFEDAPLDARFAIAVAAFGEILRGGRHTGRFGYDDVIKIALAARGDDAFGYRNEFVQLVRAARSASSLQPHRH